MKRLVEDTGVMSPSAEALAQLVRSAEPFQPNPFSKRRVRTRLNALPRRRFVWARRLTWGAVVLGLGTAAWAASGPPGWFSSSPVAPRQPEPVEAPPAQNPAAPPGPGVAPPEVSSAAPVPSASSVPADARLATPPTPSVVRAGRTDTRAADADDPARVLDAMRALRRQGDAGRAQRLLDTYLQAHPTGALAEEALALSIEAARARQDPRAAGLAQQYLSKYPKGRFVQLAQRVAPAPSASTHRAEPVSTK